MQLDEQSCVNMQVCNLQFIISNASVNSIYLHWTCLQSVHHHYAVHFHFAGLHPPILLPPGPIHQNPVEPQHKKCQYLGENSYWTLLLFIIHSEVRAIGVTRQWFFGKLYALSRSNRCVNVRPSSRAHTGALGFYAREIHGRIRAFSG